MDEIARRELTRDDGQRVTVVFYRPKVDAEGHWSCRWRAEGFEDTGPVEMHSMGVDAVQALVLAFDLVDIRLRADKNHTVTWFEEMSGDLGFQTQRSWENSQKKIADRTD